ncbi:MAG: benenodin family lasso peptide [Sphingomonas sp.]|jgi:hypothetical protein
MNPETNEAIDLIDLGVASVETQGNGTQVPDFIDSQNLAGLSDD